MAQHLAGIRQEMIIFGYIRQIEQLLQHSLMNIIPHSIISLCYEFYKCTLQLGIAYRNGRSLKRYAIMNIASKNTFECLPPNKDLEYASRNLSYHISSSLHCFIPNISYCLNIPAIKNKYRSCHGIFGSLRTFETGHRSQSIEYPHFSFIEHNENKTYFQDIVSSEPMKEFDFVLYSKQRNSVLGEHKGSLYELKLSNVVDLNFKFDVLNKSAFWANINRRNWFFQKFLMMEYMEDTDKIFAISCKTTSWSPSQSSDAKDATRICALYNFDSNDWNTIASYDYKSNDSKFSCITCYDKHLKQVYIQTNNGLTSKYDFHKDCWELVVDQKLLKRLCNRSYDIGTIWIDGHNNSQLNWCRCEMVKNDYGILKYEKSIVLKHLDLRMKDAKWVQSYEQACNLSARLFCCLMN